MPMLVDGANSLPSMMIGWVIAARMSRASRSIASRSSPTVWSTTNSSPPSRATKWPRAASCTRRPASTSNASPAGWPSVSLITLNWSRSRQCSANSEPLPVGGAEVMLELLLEHGAVGQAGQHVVEGELGDALLALGDLAGHFVEAVGEPRQLVLAAHPDLDMLARGEAPGGFVEAGERLRDPRRRLPRRQPDQQQAEQGHEAERELQLARVGHRLGLRVSEQQDRLCRRRKRSAAAWRARSSGRRRPPFRTLQAAPRCACASAAARGSRADMLPEASVHLPFAEASTAACSGIAERCSSAAHFARVEVGREHHPADQDRRHDRRGDELARAPGEDRDAGQPPVVERRPQGCGFGVAHRRVDARHPAVGRDDEGAADAQAAGRIAERRLDRRLVAARDRGAEAEIARQQLRRILKLVRALLP